LHRIRHQPFNSQLQTTFSVGDCCSSAAGASLGRACWHYLAYFCSAATLRLHSPKAPRYYCEKLIRRFPQEWQNWQIFWPGVPILFYFKEVKSIHFLPILFDPKTLKPV